MISFLFFFLLTYEKLGEHGCRPLGQPGHHTMAGTERRRRAAAREGKAGHRDVCCARRLRACSYGNGVHNGEHVDVHYYLMLWLHRERWKEALCKFNWRTARARACHDRASTVTTSARVGAGLRRSSAKDAQRSRKERRVMCDAVSERRLGFSLYSRR